MSDGEDRGPLDFEPDDEAGEDRQRRWAHRRDPDLDVTPKPPGTPVPVPRPPGASRYTWFVGVVAVLVIAVVTLNSLRTEGIGSQGVTAGERMPPFAAPLATGTLVGDVNVATERGQGEAGSRPACEVRGPQVLNGCALWESGPVALVFFGDRSERCVRQLDTFERVRARHPSVRFAAIAIRGERDKLRRMVRGRGWGFPVGYDRDGVLANIYRVAVCPQVTFARRGGLVADTTFGELDATELEAQLRRLEELDRAATP